MEKEAKIFVAGGTGMVGSAIIRKLIEKGYKNILSNYHIRPPHNTSYVKYEKLDLTRQEDTEKFFEKEKPNYVFLAAAKVGGILANNTYKAEFMYDNMAIALNVIHSSFKYGVKKLLNLGSSCIYPKHAPQPLKEECLLTGSLEPTNEPYAIAKISAIKLCRYYNEQYNTNFISVMPTNLYGPNDNYNLETAHVLPALIRKFHLAKLLDQEEFESIKKDLRSHPIGFGLSLRDNPTKDEILSILKKIGIIYNHLNPHRSQITLWGSGSPYREFLYVDDLADACVFLMERYDYQDIGEFVNIGTGEDNTIKELAHMIKEIVGFKGNIVWNTSKPDGIPRKLLDISRIRDLGWKPKIELREGIRKIYKEEFELQCSEFNGMDKEEDI
ncbi:MAG: GDP-L-fucose synthase [Deltaproteobacteria bacterium]|nr:MAG: GDP-L-fucose synthase [Spirochaetota bacterium]RLB10121.1 MAG: GDP-L-fucose synthase [Deltaproteobacteria bacterium]